MKSTNIPEVRLGIVAVSRDCFPIALSTRRRRNIVTACKTKGFEPYECSVTVENETDMLKAVEEVKAALDTVPWDYIKEVVFCGFGEPTMRLDVLLELLRYVKQQHPELPTRLNTNGLGELENGREFASEFKGILDTISISLNASNAERYFELTRAKFGIESYEAMLTFAQHCKPYVPNVVLTIVDHVEGPE